MPQLSFKNLGRAAQALVFFVSLNSFAEQKAYELPVQGASELTIRGFNGALILIKDEKSKSVSLKASTPNAVDASWWPVLERREGKIEVRIVGPSQKMDWKATLPSMNLELRSPSLSTVVVWKEGEFKTVGWDKNLQVLLQKGRVRIDDSKGSVKVVVHDGDIEINKVDGRVEVESVLASASLQKINGSLNLLNFSGKMKVVDVVGNVTLKSFQGKSNLEKIEGSFNFENSKGDIVLNDSKGSIHGKLTQGSFAAQIKGNVDVRVQAESGRIALAVPKTSGARVDLTTQDGNLYFTGIPLNQDRVGDIKLAKGRLAGSEEGVVNLRSDSGEIRIRAY